MSIENTLAERGNRYGDFTDHAEIAQALQKVMQKAERVSPVGGNSARVLSWECINPVARQALTVIADKIARILSGDPNYADNWHDIQGYAKLVEDRLPRPVEVVKPDVANCPHCGASELHQLTCPTQSVITVNLGTSLSPPVNPAEHLQRVAGMAITFGERVAIMDAYIKAGDTGETYTEYETRMLCKDQAPINPADVDIFDTDHAADGTLMLDPATWEAGDVLVCVVPGDSVRYGEKYVYTGDNDDTGRDYMVEVQPLDGGRVLAGQRYANRFRFHSRPTK